MNNQRLVGVILLVVAVVLLVMGISASDSAADRWSNFFTGEGFAMRWGAPLRWYVAHDSLAALPCAALDRVVGLVVGAATSDEEFGEDDADFLLAPRHPDDGCDGFCRSTQRTLVLVLVVEQSAVGKVCISDRWPVWLA